MTKYLCEINPIITLDYDYPTKPDAKVKYSRFAKLSTLNTLDKDSL